jgi:hypothetical protein
MPRSISAFAPATDFAPSSIDGRSFRSVYGFTLALLKYGETRDGAHMRKHTVGS